MRMKVGSILDRRQAYSERFLSFGFWQSPWQHAEYGRYLTSRFEAEKFDPTRGSLDRLPPCIEMRADDALWAARAMAFNNELIRAMVGVVRVQQPAAAAY